VKDRPKSAMAKAINKEQYDFQVCCDKCNEWVTLVNIPKYKEKRMPKKWYCDRCLEKKNMMIKSDDFKMKVLVPLARHTNGDRANPICQLFLSAAYLREKKQKSWSPSELWKDIKQMTGNSQFTKPNWIITKNPHWFNRISTGRYQLDISIYPRNSWSVTSSSTNSDSNIQNGSL
tara:strand:- start:9670 stop:10194 length:525 start_codon:yes stop_codon:yes gene_type:complete